MIASPSLSRNFLVAAGAVALVLIANLVNFLRFHGYPLMTPEVLAIGLGMAAVGAGVAAIYLPVGRMGRAVIDALMVGLAVDLNAEGLAPVAASAAAALLLALLVRRSLLAPLGFMAAVALMLVLVGVGRTEAKAPEPAAAGEAGRPAILHIILDEHIGIEGLPEANTATPALRDELKAFYLERGFRLYGRAYSLHMHTVNVLPQMVNYGELQPAQRNQSRKGVKLNANPWFDRLRAQGYAINVYQNAFVDFCHKRPEVRCVTYPHASLGEVAAAPLSLSDKTATLAVNFVALSDTVVELAKRYDWWGVDARKRGIPAPAIGLDLHRQTSTIPSLASARRLIADLENAQPGQAYVAHLLLPHGPYATDADCGLRPRGDWHFSRSREPIRRREAAYFEQVRCTTKLVGEALAALERSPGGKGAIVLVHGDHGSRITYMAPMSYSPVVNDRDLVAVHSTLFAVRAPGIDPGYEEGPAALPDLFTALATSDFSAAPVADADGTVMLPNRRARPEKKAALPDGW